MCQLEFLKLRIQIHKKINSNGGGIQDRSVYEDTVFARVAYALGNMTQDEYTNYCNQSTHLMENLKNPNLFIYLKVSPETCLKRIKERYTNTGFFTLLFNNIRDRDYERNITIDYLRELEREYNHLMEDLSDRFKVLVLDWENYGSSEQVAKQIEALI